MGLIDQHNTLSHPVQPELSEGHCTRCGTCCRKGGPSLHRADRDLVESGRIPLRDLFTIRKGEPSFDNVINRIEPAASDIIKIKGQGGRWTCRYLYVENNTCRIYSHRPAECRALKCWDTRDISELYDRDRLTRRDLLGAVDGLWQMVQDHQAECSYDRLRKWMAALNDERRAAALERIGEMVHIDGKLRQRVTETSKMDPGITDFLFGRSLTETIQLLGYRLEREGDRFRLRPQPVRRRQSCKPVKLPETEI